MASTSQLPADISPEELSREQAEQELARLSAEILYHDERYHGEDAPEISDAAYDASAGGAILPLSKCSRIWCAKILPSRRVGFGALDKFEKITHSIPMLSLGNAFSDEDVVDFWDRIVQFLKLAVSTGADGRAQN